jgi:D-3-phosphoglycerate dehydrogenase
MLKNASFPKHKIKVLLLENIHENAVQFFSDEQFQIETLKGSLTEKELIEKIKDIHVLGIRSKTFITKEILYHATRLLCIGTYCIGTNQVDTVACAEKGIAVFNAPYSNTLSVVELAVGEMIMLLRNVFTKSNQMHEGKWDKSANNSFEIRGKKLGLIGYGNIGTQFSIIAESLGMQVYFYDINEKLILGNAKRCKTMHEILQTVDVISMYVDGRESNTNLIGEKEFSMMKDGVIFMNLSRGHVVNMHALKHAIETKKVSGASVDVFPEEPIANSNDFKTEIQNLPNTILTPHIGGSTEEAQANIGNYVSAKITNYINKGDTYGAVNFPELLLPSFENTHRMLHIHKNVPGILAKINQLFATKHVNIQAQYLKTIDSIGYVITDINKNYDDTLVQELKTIDNTIKFRVLY